MSPTPLLELRGVFAGYHGSIVVRDLNISLNQGHVTAVLGPNGAGKTTTLRAITGLIPCSKGGVYFQGEDIAGMTPQARARAGVVMVSERRGIFSSLTVSEHLRLRYPGQDLNSDLAFDMFPALAPLRSRRAGLLSGGEQQMLGLARAFIRRPKVLMIDEMSLGLAPVIVERLLPVIRRIADETGTAVLLVEQHVYLALETADYAVVLAHGDTVLQGPAAELSQDAQLIQTSYLGAQAISDEVPEV